MFVDAGATAARANAGFMSRIATSDYAEILKKNKPKPDKMRGLHLGVVSF